MKRVLVIAYNFPPLVSIASARAIRFLRYLEASGWTADILTARTSRYKVIDHGSGKDMPAGVRIFRECAEEQGRGRPDDLHL